MIKFQKHAVVNSENGIKARVWYGVDNRVDGRKSVNIDAKDYGSDLWKVFAAVEGTNYRNDTDTQTDYFDTGRVVLFEDHPIYAEARQRAETNEADRLAKMAAYDKKLAERRASY